jgi:hypothetical protein
MTNFHFRSEQHCIRGIDLNMGINGHFSANSMKQQLLGAVHRTQRVRPVLISL